MIILDIIMVFGPVLGYIQQYNMIRKTQKIGNFSIDVCAILLISNIMRIFFWFAVGFGTPLLLQALLMIIAQFMLLNVSIKAKYSEQSKANNGNKEFDIFKFWRWSQFEHYTRFLVGMSTILALSTLIFSYFLENKFYGQLIGFFSMSIQATLGIPQLIKNQQNRSTSGLSIILIGSWFLGDSFKTVYFIIDNQPFQFKMCGATQLIVDILIMLQIVLFKKKTTLKYDPIQSQ